MDSALGLSSKFIPIILAASAKHPYFVPTPYHLHGDSQRPFVNADQRVAILIIDHAIGDK
jgi:hypothetical protein